MNEPVVACPKCGTEIKLTETLAAPMVAELEKKYKKQLEDVIRRVEDDKTALKVEQEELAAQHEQFEAKVQEMVKRGQSRIREEEKNRLASAMQAQQDELAIKDTKLAEAQKEQANLLRKQRGLDEEKRELDLTVEKKIQEGLGAARDKARKDAEDLIGLRLREKEETIASMQNKIEELRRKAEQGSQQLQGEVLELQIEETLKAMFPDDTIEPVPKGVHGGDITHSVVSGSGRVAGTILWEIKRTKTWSSLWLTKLREDQRAAKADIAVIVTQTLPKDVETFELIDGVWVTSISTATPMASILRQSLLDVAIAKTVADGMQTKAEEVYAYLTGAQFKRRVGAIVEAFTAMASDLEKEKKVYTKHWAKREQQITRVMTATAGMSGDLQGITGDELEEVEGLGMKVLGD